MRRNSLVVVANRLPVDETVAPDGVREWRRSPGGLVSALHPSLAHTQATWVGWTGALDAAPELPDLAGVRLRAVPLSKVDFEEYYEGFANSTLWPLYHDATEQPVYHRRWWESYQRVNRRFAEAAAEAAPPNATVWIHDYHLQLVPAMLRGLRPDVRIGFFMHIPFPPAELFMQLPRRNDLLYGLLGADLVGFQDQYGARNFTQLASRVLGLPVRHPEIEVNGRVVRVGAFPNSIDMADMEALARRDEVVKRAAQIREDLGNPEKIILGVDRLDYTKGIEQRLKAYRELLSDGRVKVQDTVMVQVAVPSRERVAHYRILRDRVEREVGRINGEFGRVGVAAIHYLINQSFDRTELAALYRAADVMMITPLRDGMNLVAKEYVASRVDVSGALVLSEFAGAAGELTDAYLVNPHDLDGLKDTLVRVLEASTGDTSRRMRMMRRHVRAHDVRAWAQSYLSALHDASGLGRLVL
ncbi:trehalose-6-phosphate synthase [Luedemannella flava]|uniref:alpha,alpha-trehalose-phosphate synthase (UDP-forming) n=1 Tax=Luedemannella flava TaxID=349316 RepID=UPI0031D93153